MVKEGDKNTKFFHGVASRRRRNNMTKKIKDEEGNWHEKQEELEEVFLSYFSKIFSTSNHSNMKSVLQVMEGRISDAMNESLDKDFSEVEIKMALDQMNPNKAPRPDGMTACFYQKYWHIVVKDACSIILDFLNNGVSLSDINHTNVVLMPKTHSPISAKNFRPISLCNVVYKIIFKVLVNRTLIL